MGLSITLTREGLPRLRKASNQIAAEIAIVGGRLSIHTIPAVGPLGDIFIRNVSVINSSSIGTLEA